MGKKNGIRYSVQSGDSPGVVNNKTPGKPKRDLTKTSTKRRIVKQSLNQRTKGDRYINKHAYEDEIVTNPKRKFNRLNQKSRSYWLNAASKLDKDSVRANQNANMQNKRLAKKRK